MAADTILPAERIRDLSAINGEVAAMLESAGLAINALTDRPLKAAADGEDTRMETDSDGASVEQRKQAFAENTRAYYTHLQAITARLRRHAYALEEAGIISPEAMTSTVTTQQSQAGLAQRGSAAAPGQEVERITNGGIGNLDVGWLNSRGNKVGVDKERELIEEVKTLLQETVLREEAEETVHGT